MPVCKLDPCDPWGQYSKDDLESLFGSDEELFNRIDLMSFDLDDVDPSVFDSSYDSEDDSDGECLNSKKFRESRNHDCMWGGQCCNKEFQRTTVGPVPKPQPPPPAPVVPTSIPKPVTTPGVLITHSANKVVTIVPASERTEVRTVKPESRSLLLNRTTVTPPKPSVPTHTPAYTNTTPVKRELPTPQNSRPDTPQSEDDDLAPIPIDPHNTTSVFRSALEAITTPKAWEPEVPPQTDHNYDVSSKKNIRPEELGVVTPSDSEEDEEIDVVSLSERSSSSSSRSSSCGGNLPNRPTRRDQRHLEEITTSLLSASEAVSRKLKASHQVVRQHHQHKRKKYISESSDSDSDYDEPVYKYSRQTKRQKSTPTRRKKNPRFGEEEDQEKRDLHNNMERMRRIDLRNSFEELKTLVPSLVGKDRAAKVVILRDAASYCQELSAESQSKYMQVQALRKEQERLRAMVSSLRKARAAATIKNR
ncbi:transcriptional regulator Myc-2-like [Macrosteles quadrilineatus]|uniref:transcriptional regulator Myc-2-like n=1 Tax=Macrosteles quadrilineatus TaxID=74068 RepID=UPI0023E23AF4|nr:transcriptional regulator Myc-2-like [Macrosteles quadrilineatus]